MCRDFFFFLNAFLRCVHTHKKNQTPTLEMTAAVYLLPRLCRDIGSSVTEELFDVLSHAYAGEHSFGTDEICITNWPLVPDNSSCFRLLLFLFALS